MSEIKAFMEELKRNLEREIGYRKRMINLAPKGSLVIRVRDSYRYLCHQIRDKNGHRREEVLHESDRKLVERIQLRYISQAYVRMLTRSLKYVIRFLKVYEPHSLELARQSVHEVYRSPLDYQGFSSPVSQGYENQFHTENLIHKNSVGDCFRSKGEVQISELLVNRKISYTYEPKLLLPDGLIYPDFEVRLPGELTSKYIEYCGMLENDSYLERTTKKIRSYLRGGKKLGRDVLFFFEDGDNGMDVQLMKRDLEGFLGITL